MNENALILYVKKGFGLCLLSILCINSISAFGAGNWDFITPSSQKLTYPIFEDICFVDKKNGWVVATQGILHTSNGGIIWTLQNTTTFLMSIHFSDTNRGWAVGQSGTILHTADGGINWKSQNSNTGEHLNSIHFIDTSRGWIVGRLGTILHTADGGINWKSQNSNISEHLNSVYFISASYGWAVGRNSTVLYTRDGGVTWSKQEVPEEVAKKSLTSVRFIDTIHGWVGSSQGTVLYTEDSGENWIVHKELSAVYFHFSDTNHGWATGKGDLYHTSDGGKKWSKLDVPGLPRYIKKVYFADAENAWSIGRSNIWHTKDGGIIWREQFPQERQWLSSIYFVDAYNGWIVGSYEDFIPGTYDRTYVGLILNTNDSGATWLLQYLDPYRDEVVDTGLSSVYFIDDYTGWAVGGNGTILYTIDGGFTWSQQVSNTDNPLYSVYFMDDNRGWAVGTNCVVLRTTDGGNSWTSQITGNVDYLDSVYFADAKHGWIAGGDYSFREPQRGVIYHTEDEGVTWTLQHIGENSLHSVHFVDIYNGLAVGNNGVILRTDNGGLTWVPQISNTNKDLNSVQFVSANAIWIAGSEGTLLHSNDSGISWELEISDIFRDADFNRINFADANSGWAIVTPPNGHNEILEYDSSSNNSPILTLHPDGNQKVDVGKTLTISVTAVDPDDDVIALRVTELPENASFDIKTGSFNFTPTSTQIGEYIITFRADDGYGGVDERKVVIAVGSDERLKWKYFLFRRVKSSPAIDSDGTIYAGSPAALLYAVNPDGTLKWRRQEVGGMDSSPAIGSNGTIYVGAADSLCAFNPNGHLKWEYKAEDSIESSPAIGHEGTIYFGSNDDCLYAVNSNGALKWRYQTGAAIWSSPAVGGDGTIYVGSRDNYLYAVNSNGALKWRYQTGAAIWSSPALGGDGTIYVSSRDNYLYAVNPNGTLKWRYQTGGWWSSPTVGNNGTIYVGYDDLYAVNPDGTLKWKYQTGGSYDTSPAIGSDGTIYIGSRNGYFYAVNPDGTLKWKYQTGGSYDTSPAIGSDGTIYVISSDGYLYALKSTSHGLADSPWPKFHHDNQNTGRVTATVSSSQEEIPLGQGWNLISFRTKLSDPNVASVLASIKGNYEYVSSYVASEGVKSWDANRPAFLSDLKEMDAYHGYWIKMTKPATLILEGMPVPVDTTIQLGEGWNLISYLPDQPDSIPHALASIDGLYTYLSGYINGEGVKSWDKTRPIFLNDLKDLIPNHGYWIKMAKAATLKYPTSGYSPVSPAAPAKLMVTNTSNLFVRGFNPRTSLVIPSPISADFWGVDTVLKVGDGITVKNAEGVLCGSATVNYDGAYLIHVYGDMPATKENDGVKDKNMLDFFVNGQKIIPHEGRAYFVPSASTRITLSRPRSESKPIIPKTSVLFQNFPNPFNPETWLPYQLAEKSKVTITIYDASGRLVRIIDLGEKTAGIYTEKSNAAYWDGRNQTGEFVASGVYFYHIKAGNFTAQRKLLIIR